jgi:hypothetical protein
MAPPLSDSSRFRNWDEKKEADIQPLDKASVVKFEDMMNADKSLGAVDVPDAKFAQESRPSTPSPQDIADGWYKPSKGKSSSKSALAPIDDTFDQPSSEPVTIEVKPLPKIRLSLMPSPREEDEENLGDDGEPLNSKKSRSSKSKSRSKSSTSSAAADKTKSSKPKSSSRRGPWARRLGGSREKE